MCTKNKTTLTLVVLSLFFALLVHEAFAHGVKHAAKTGLTSSVSIYTVSAGQITSLGSGVIVDSSGTIITNKHVVDSGDYWFAVLPDGRHVGVNVIKKSNTVDLAIVRVNQNNVEGVMLQQLTPIRFAAKPLEIGDQVIAVGNPLNVGISVTSGVLSAYRAYEGSNAIQHDAAVNHGSSGGALLNEEGELVGVNVAIRAVADGFVGIAIAIPAAQVRNFLEN